MLPILIHRNIWSIRRTLVHINLIISTLAIHSAMCVFVCCVRWMFNVDCILNHPYIYIAFVLCVILLRFFCDIECWNIVFHVDVFLHLCLHSHNITFIIANVSDFRLFVLRSIKMASSWCMQWNFTLICLIRMQPSWRILNLKQHSQIAYWQPFIAIDWDESYLYALQINWRVK